jgi:hypothetical protein
MGSGQASASRSKLTQVQLVRALDRASGPGQGEHARIGVGVEDLDVRQALGDAQRQVGAFPFSR